MDYKRIEIQTQIEPHRKAQGLRRGLELRPRIEAHPLEKNCSIFYPFNDQRQLLTTLETVLLTAVSIWYFQFREL